MRMFRTAIALAAVAALCGGYALAVDQSLIGKKLLIKTPPSGTTNNKVVFLSKDVTITQPTAGSVAEDPTMPAGGRIHVSGDGGDFSISLPAANWENKGNGFWKYKDTTGATCRVVLIKNNRLNKAVCKGTQVAYTLGTAQGAIDVIVGTGTTRRYCYEFDGTAGAGTTPVECDEKKDGSDGKKYLAKNCTNAVVGCPSPSGAFLDGTSALF